jgi:hypothetical protein
VNACLPKTFARRPLPRHRMEPIKMTFSTRFLEFTDGGLWEVRWQEWIMDLLAKQGVTVEENDIACAFDAEAGEINVEVWIRPRPRILEAVQIDLTYSGVRAEDLVS